MYLLQRPGWDGAWAPRSLIVGLLSTWIESAALLGGVLCVWWRGPLGCWSLGCGFFPSFSFPARVYGQFDEAFAFLRVFMPFPAPKGVQTAQGLYHGTVIHFPLGIFPSPYPFRSPCGGRPAVPRLPCAGSSVCRPTGFCCAAKCPEQGNN